jgi:hypothetical protein
MRQWRKRIENVDRLRVQAKEQARKAGRARYPAKLKWKELNPRAARAHHLVYKAVKARKLIRPESCSRCGKKCKPHAHHKDYEKPLDVLWLCIVCHESEHAAQIGGGL